jgi:hypothetical protein
MAENILNCLDNIIIGILALIVGKAAFIGHFSGATAVFPTWVSMVLSTSRFASFL